MADIARTLGLQKRIALIAHDHKKEALIRWCQKNRDILGQHFLCGTGTTARMDFREHGTSGRSAEERSFGRRPGGGSPHCGRENRYGDFLQ